MLKGLDPLLDAELLYVLRQMGHADELAIVDTNFPAARLARTTAHGRPLVLGGVGAPRAIGAVLSLMPLDDFIPNPAWRMEAEGEASLVPAVQQEVQAEVDRAQGFHLPMQVIRRADFYLRAAAAYAILVTGETRLYGCFVLTKGVVRPAA